MIIASLSCPFNIFFYWLRSPFPLPPPPTTWVGTGYFKSYFILCGFNERLIFIWVLFVFQDRIVWLLKCTNWRWWSRLWWWPFWVEWGLNDWWFTFDMLFVIPECLWASENVDEIVFVFGGVCSIGGWVWSGRRSSSWWGKAKIISSSHILLLKINIIG